MFKPVEEIDKILLAKKESLYIERDKEDRKLIAELIEEATKRAEAAVSIDNEWELLDKDEVPLIHFTIDHNVSREIIEDLRKAYWVVRCDGNGRLGKIKIDVQSR